MATLNKRWRVRILVESKRNSAMVIFEVPKNTYLICLLVIRWMYASLVCLLWCIFLEIEWCRRVFLANSPIIVSNGTEMCSVSLYDMAFYNLINYLSAATEENSIATKGKVPLCAFTNYRGLILLELLPFTSNQHECEMVCFGICHITY